MNTLLKKYIGTLIAIFAMSLISSCNDDENVMGEESVRFSISASAQMPGEESRAVLSTEVNITNYVFLMFNGKSASATKVKQIELTPDQMPFYTMMPGPGEGQTYAAMLLANVSASDLGDVTTLGDLVNKTKTIDRFYNKPTSNTDFTWSGYLDVTTASNALNFVVNPNMAKMTMKFTNTVDEADIVNVRMRNVPNKVGLAQNALNLCGITTAISDVSYIDYEIENISVKKGGSHSDAWYVPQNMQGTVTGGRLESSANKPPTNATYLEFDVLSKVFTTPMASAYKIYPGIREANVSGYAAMADFNVKSGVIYEMTAQITTDGISGSVGNGFSAEAKNAVAKIKLPTGSNCYMIHPIGDRITTGNGTLYELPIDRINEYWQGVRNSDVPANVVNENTQWEAVVIWQDLNKRIIYFTDENGDGNLNTYSGVGNQPFYFKLVNTDTDPKNQNYGNIVVGVRLKGSTTYLWSWHLWVTDYNPDAAPSHSTAKSLNSSLANNMYAQNGHSYTKIDLQGGNYYKDDGTINTDGTWGNVQHFHCLYSGYWTEISKNLWDTGMYADKWMMDRNLGAQLPSNIDAVSPLQGYGVYYQYGRKDPFSYNYTYNIDGSQRSGYTTIGAQWAKGSSGTIAKGVQNPNTFYSASGKWASDATTYSWYSPVGDPLNPSTVGDKTMFDPCPPGWCLPIRNSVYFGTLNNSLYLLPDAAQTTSNRYSNLHAALTLNYDVTGLSSWTIKDKYRNMALLQSSGSIVDGTVTKYRDLGAVFPLQGYIEGTTGNILGISTDIASVYGYMWFADYPNTSTYQVPLMQFYYAALASVNSYSRQRGSRIVRYYGGKMTFTNGIASQGQNVRCIQE